MLAVSAVVAAPCAALAATPTAKFQDASIIGASQDILVSRVPTISSAGKVTYYDVTIAFSVSGSGQLSLSATQSPPTLSPKLIIAGFKAGTYGSNSSAGISVAGPGVGGPGGQTAWSLSATSGSCTQPPSTTWYTGPIAQNPYAKRLEAAKITLTQYSYGIIGGGSMLQQAPQAARLLRTIHYMVSPDPLPACLVPPPRPRRGDTVDTAVAAPPALPPPEPPEPLAVAPPPAPPPGPPGPGFVPLPCGPGISVFPGFAIPVA